jgi:hypothetical protein
VFPSRIWVDRFGPLSGGPRTAARRVRGSRRVPTHCLWFPRLLNAGQSVPCQNAALQVARIRPTLRLRARCRLRTRQPPTPSDLPPHPARLSGAGQGRLACRDSSGVRPTRSPGIFTRRPGSHDKDHPVLIAVLSSCLPKRIMSRTTRIRRLRDKRNSAGHTLPTIAPPIARQSPGNRRIHAPTHSDATAATAGNSQLQ